MLHAHDGEDGSLIVIWSFVMYGRGWIRASIMESSDAMIILLVWICLLPIIRVISCRRHVQHYSKTPHRQYKSLPFRPPRDLSSPPYGTTGTTSSSISPISPICHTAACSPISALQFLCRPFLVSSPSAI